jgi:hypothetical protein
MSSFYYLVTVDKNSFNDNNYNFVLVAFDDENGQSINSKFIIDHELNMFNQGQNIHYEEYFLTDRIPTRVVYWAHSEEKGWCERVEHKIN